MRLMNHAPPVTGIATARRASQKDFAGNKAGRNFKDLQLQPTARAINSTPVGAGNLGEKNSGAIDFGALDKTVTFGHRSAPVHGIA